MFPAPGLALASTAHVYPEVVNGQAVIGVADRAVAGILERLAEPQRIASGGMSAIAVGRSAPARPRALVAVSPDGIAVGRSRVLGVALLALTWRHVGRPRPRHRLRPRRRLAASRTASFPYVDFVYYYGPLAPFRARRSPTLVGGAGLDAGGRRRARRSPRDRRPRPTRSRGALVGAAGAFLAARDHGSASSLADQLQLRPRRTPIGEPLGTARRPARAAVARRTATRDRRRGAAARGRRLGALAASSR